MFLIIYLLVLQTTKIKIDGTKNSFVTPCAEAEQANIFVINPQILRKFQECAKSFPSIYIKFAEKLAV